MDTLRLKRNFLIKLAQFLGKILKIELPPAPSVSAIIHKGGKILAIKMSYKDGYSLPGGMLKTNENFEEGIRREVYEETGFRIKSLKYFNEYAFEVEYPTVNITYLAKASGKTKSSKEGKPIWIDPTKNLEKFVYSDNVKALKDYIKDKKTWKKV